MMGSREYRSSLVEFRSALDSPTQNQFLSRISLDLTVFLALLSGYILGRFRFSFTLVLFFLYAFSFVFTRQKNKYVKSLKSLVYKQALKQKRGNIERVTWLNQIISRVWHVLEPEVSKEVFRTINPLLQEKCPSFLAGIKLTTFTLGSTPPFVDGIIFYEEADEQLVTFECHVNFQPLEVGKDAFAFVTRNKKFQWNSRIQLIARFGTGVQQLGMNLPLLVKEISFSGKLRISMRLVHDLSLVRFVNICFTEDPEIDFTVVPLKTVDLMNVPVLSKWIDAVIKSSLRKMLVNPNSMTIDLKKTDVKHTQGILFVYICALKLRDKRSVYLELNLDGRRLRQTRKIEGPKASVSEYFYIFVDSANTLLAIRALTDKKKETAFAEAYVDLRKVRLLKNHYETKRLYHKGNVNSTVSLHMYYQPCVKRSQNETDNFDPDFSDDRNPATKNQNNSLPEAEIHNALHSAHDLDAKNSPNTPKNVYDVSSGLKMIVKAKLIGVEDIRASSGDKKRIISPYFTVVVCPKHAKTTKGKHSNVLKNTAAFVGNIFGDSGDVDELLSSSNHTMFAHKSKCIIETNSPLFNEKFSFVSTDYKNDIMYIKVHDSSDDSVIGSFDIPINDLKQGDVVFQLKDCQSGDLKMYFDLFVEENTNSIDFVPFNSAIRLEIHNLVSMYDEGVFFCIIENSNNFFYHDPFMLGDFITKQEFIFPAISDTFLVHVFKENKKENDYIGCCSISTENKHEIDNKAKLKEILAPKIIHHEIHKNFRDEIQKSQQTQSTNIKDTESHNSNLKYSNIAQDRNIEIGQIDPSESIRKQHTGNVFKSTTLKSDLDDPFNPMTEVEEGPILEKSRVIESIKLDSLRFDIPLDMVTSFIDKVLEMQNKKPTITLVTDKEALDIGLKPLPQKYNADQNKKLLKTFLHVLNSKISTILHNEKGKVNLKQLAKGGISEHFNSQNPVKTQKKNFITMIMNKNEDCGELHYTLEKAPLLKYKGTAEAEDNFKIIQAKFTDFKNISEDFFIEFYTNDELIQRSLKSIRRSIDSRFIFLAGKSEIRAVFKSANQGKPTFLGDCLIPKRQMKENVMLDEKNFQANVEISVFGCNFTKIDRANSGLLEIFVKQARNLKAVDKESADPFLQIYLNGILLHKTEVKKNTLNPVFSESFKTKAKRMTDILRIELFDWNQIESNKLVAYREFPLYFLKEGTMDFLIKLMDKHSFKHDAGELQITFNFQKLTK